MSAGLTTIRFAKMQGAGNDYIYIDATRKCPTDLPVLARRISDRHFGVGADGLVVILPSAKADFRMRMFNSDGSEAQMCGNASRCIGKYVYDKGLTTADSLTLETLAGVRRLKLHFGEDGTVKNVTVNMGIPTFRPEIIPADLPADYSEGSPVIVEESDRSFRIYPAGMGNPHGVIFTGDLTDENVLGFGPKLERNVLWPEKSNIEFVEILSRGKIRVRVWERGSGETMACGTGACAAVAAGVLAGFLDPGKVVVEMRGGNLTIDWRGPGSEIYLTGGASFICEGDFFL